MIKPCILVVDDEPHSRFGICQILTDEGFNAVPAENGKEALEKIKTEFVNIVITDERMPDLSGMELLSEVKRIEPQIAVIIMTAYGSVSMAVEALKQGAFYFFEKPILSNLEQFLTIIRQAFRAQEMEKEIDHLRKEVREKYSFARIIGSHPKMIEVFEIIKRVGPTDKTVLIQGESGTGKDLIAKTIHYNSLRRGRPLVTVDCGAITETLLTSELFGHAKGAFTGAVKETIGRFQAADGGTLILEEIGEIPLHLQKTFLRVLEEKEFQRVGSHSSIKVDVRILFTTNRNLREDVAKGNFREDLYYRVSVVPLTIPPLRERASDIPLLVDHFVRSYQEKKVPVRIEPEVFDQLNSYHWPGNVRELANTIQQMMVFCNRNLITINDLPPHLFSQENKMRVQQGGKIRLSKMVSDLEKRWIINKLKESSWNIEKATELLGLTRKMLTSRIRKYKIKAPPKRLLHN